MDSKKNTWIAFKSKFRWHFINGSNEKLALSSTSKLNMWKKKIYSSTKPPIHRFAVPDDKVPWSVAFDEYTPVPFTANHLRKKPHPDAILDSESKEPNVKIPFNEYDRYILSYWSFVCVCVCVLLLVILCCVLCYVCVS